MVKRVSCGAVVNGVQLTTLKEMARCEKSDLTRSRAVPTNSGQRVEKVLTVKDIKAVKKLVLKRIDEDNDGTFIGRQGGSVLWCTACRSPVDHSKGHVNEHISTKKQLEALKSNSKSLIECSRQRLFIQEYFRRTHAKGETIDLKTLEFRFESLSTFLLNGTPIHRIDSFRSDLEK